MVNYTSLINCSVFFLQNNQDGSSGAALTVSLLKFLYFWFIASQRVASEILRGSILANLLTSFFLRDTLCGTWQFWKCIVVNWMNKVEMVFICLVKACYKIRRYGFAS